MVFVRWSHFVPDCRPYTVYLNVLYTKGGAIPERRATRHYISTEQAQNAAGRLSKKCPYYLINFQLVCPPSKDTLTSLPCWEYQRSSRNLHANYARCIYSIKKNPIINGPTFFLNFFYALSFHQRLVNCTINKLHKIKHKIHNSKLLVQTRHINTWSIFTSVYKFGCLKVPKFKGNLFYVLWRSPSFKGHYLC